METKTLDINKFSKEVSHTLQSRNAIEKSFIDLEEFPIIPGKQCIYILDWKKSKILYSRGVEEMLGYTKDEFSMETVLNYFHPDDIKFVRRIIKAIVQHVISKDVSDNKMYLNLTFRLRKKDNTYLKVLRQSRTYVTDNENGSLISNLSMLTDVSFISNNNKVEWDLYAKDINTKLFRENVFKEFVDFFTKRELEIINLIAKDYTNKKIALKLFVSEHTISTHRKNIMKKSNCHSVKELLDFCNKHGIL